MKILKALLILITAFIVAGSTHALIVHTRIAPLGLLLIYLLIFIFYKLLKKYQKNIYKILYEITKHAAVWRLEILLAIIAVLLFLIVIRIY